MSSLRVVRAVFDDDDITVYQAYPSVIAEAALRAGTFVEPFKRERMTWIKPSFLWMMYRSGWATKPNQERVIAIKMSREGFEWTLAHSCTSQFDPRTYENYDCWRDQLRASPVRIQWDPDRSVTLAPLQRRAIQIGLSGEAVHHFLDDWISDLTDMTNDAHAIRALVLSDRIDEARDRLPDEGNYPLSVSLAAKIGAQD